MTQEELDVYNALNNIIPFAKSHAPGFATTSNAHTDFARIPAIITEIGPVDTNAGADESPETKKKAALIRNLWDDLKAIAKTARTISRSEPGFHVPYKLGDDSQVSVFNTAKDVLDALQAPGVAAKFIAFDMPATFVADLQADIGAIGGVGEDQDEDQQTGSRTTAKVRKLIKEGRELITRLDTSVRNRFRDAEEILAEWQTASHIRRRRSQPTDTPATPIVTPV